MAYIDRDKLIKELSTLYKEPTSTEDFMTIGYDKAIADGVVTAHRQPTADVAEVKHGYFIGTEFDGYADGYPVFYEWKCSECGCIFEDEEPTYNYCPQCGAKMDGKETEDGEIH